MEGVRAAVTVALPVALNQWLQWPPMMEFALAAWLTCLCDQGGPIRSRLPSVFGFAFSGALLAGSGSLLRGEGTVVALTLVMAGLLVFGMLRIYGASWIVVGNLLSVVLIFSTARPLPAHDCLVQGLAFLGGGLWSGVMTMTIWRIYPFQPARRALANVFQAQAELVAGLLQALNRTQEKPATSWDTHARAHRREVRAVLETANTLVLGLSRARGPLGTAAGQCLVRLDAAEKTFGGLVALSALLEQAGIDRIRVSRLLLRLERVLLAQAHGFVNNETDRLQRCEQALAALETALAQEPPTDEMMAAFRQIVRASGDALGHGQVRLASRLPAGSATTIPWATRIWAPLVANLSLNSLTLRHALRVLVTVSFGVLIGMLHPHPHEIWLSITLVLTMQPQFASTRTKTIERIGGTVLGGLIAAAISLFCSTPLAMAAAMFPIAVVALALRNVNYGVFVTSLTPLVVLLSEFSDPGSAIWVVAFQRMGYTLAGGLIGFVGSLLLWPNWDSQTLRGEIEGVVAAYRRYLEAQLSDLLNQEASGTAGPARRLAGLASNNVEASLARALQEPRRQLRDIQLQKIIAIDAAMRRLGGRIALLPLLKSRLSEAEVTRALGLLRVDPQIHPTDSTSREQAPGLRSELEEPIEMLRSAHRSIQDLTG